MSEMKRMHISRDILMDCPACDDWKLRVLGPHERNLKELERSNELIDVLHKASILWKEGRREELKESLTESGWGTKDTFYKVAQAILGVLSLRTKERGLLEGFLSGKEKLIAEIKPAIRQRRLFE